MGNLKKERQKRQLNKNKARHAIYKGRNRARNKKGDK
jgi:hypothetical protein